MPGAKPMVSLITTPPNEARRIASAIVERKLAACVNIVSTVHSLYWWEGAVQEDDEALLVVKTTHEALPALDALLREIHPYETFELVSLDIDAGSTPYLDWIRASVQAPRS